MDKYGLADLYYWRAIDAAAKGLKQKEAEYKEISKAVYDRALVDEHGHVALDITRILNWKPCFERPSYAWPRFAWYEDETWLKAFWIWFTDEWNWKKNCSPGFPEFFSRVWKNVKIVFYWYLSPWFHMRYWFLDAFINRNDCKLLDSDINWAYIRNRQSDMAYYTLELCGFHYTLTKMQIMEDGKEGGQNGFLLGICVGLANMTDEEREAAEAKIHEVRTKVCSGWIFGWKSFVREFNKVVEKTPDLNWFKSM